MEFCTTIRCEERSSKRMKLDHQEALCVQEINGLSQQIDLPYAVKNDVTSPQLATCDNIWDEASYSLPIGPPKANEDSTPEKKAFDEIIVSFMKEQHIPGSSLCIGFKGKIVYTQCYGWATHNILVRPHNRFCIASITKALTATGVMNLVEQGKLKLQDKVFGPKGILSEYSPGVKGDRRLLRITVKHLLQHSAGWDREEVGDPVFWRHVAGEMGVSEPVPQHVLIQYMMDQKLQFSPGLRHAYSNLGYEILGRVIEKISKESYEKFIIKILKNVDIINMKLGKTHKHLTEPDEVEYFASPKFKFVESIFPGEGRVPAPYGGFAMETGDADGGWIATATDLVRFFQALDGSGPKRIIKAKTFKMMTDRPSYMKGSTAWYGFGLDVSWNRKAWEHSGTLDGATSSLVHDRHGYVFAMLCNYWPTDSDYTSVVSYALAHVDAWSKFKKAIVPNTHAATLDKHYAVSVQIAYNDYPTNALAMKSQGYSVKWITAYQLKSETYFTVIWNNQQTSKMCHSMSKNELLQLISHHNINVLHVDSYVLNNSVCYAVIYEENNNFSSKWKLIPSLPVGHVTDIISKEKSENYTLTHLSITHCQGNGQATLLFRLLDDKNSCWVKTDLNSTAYQSDFNKHSRYGHMLTYVKPYIGPNNEVLFSTIWTNPGPYQYTSEFDMSKYRLLNDFLFAADMKFQPLCLCGYEDENAEKYVAVCIKQVPPKSV